MLDLYCGTGALAIEAISRGADSAVLVDRKTALAKRNVTEARDRQPLRADPLRRARATWEATQERFGLILCDPPYTLADPLDSKLVQQLPARLAKYGRLAIESSARKPLEVDLPLLAERRIGEALIRIYSER